MTPTTVPSISLEEFLAMPETEPASEYIDGQIIQKLAAQGQHSRLQGALVTTINQISEPEQVALAFPELRCTFAERVIVPDVAVFAWGRVPLTEDGDIPDDFRLVPDWAVEILSPEQSPTKLIDKLVHCIRQGAQLGWLVDPGELAITSFLPDQLPSVLQGSDLLPVLSGLPLELTANDVFGWLRVGRR